MISTAILSAVGGLFAGALALAVLVRPPRQLVQWSFAAGMMVLASEALCVAQTQVSSVILWRQFSFLSMALLPAPWLLFSLVFARGDYPVDRKSVIALACACIMPAAVVFTGWDQLVLSAPSERLADPLNLRLGWSGKALQVWLLVGSVAILTNLERTFRSSIGTIRWKIKFMLVALGLLFIVSIYSSSQLLLQSSFLPWRAVS